jgi:hypothetical protein
MLVGRIGEDGPIFPIGRRYEGMPTRAGTLYLGIIPIGGNNVPAGKYQVKITAPQE